MIFKFLLTLIFSFNLLLAQDSAVDSDRADDLSNSSSDEKIVDENSVDDLSSSFESENIKNIDIQDLIQKLQDDPSKAFELLDKIKSQGGNLPPEVEQHFAQLKSMLNSNGKRESEAIMRQTLDQVRNISPSEMKKSIKEKLAFHPIGSKLVKNEKILNFMVAFIQDANALPKLAAIADQGGKVKVYAILNILTIVFSFFWRRRAIRARRGIGHAFFRFFLINGVRFYLAWFFFKPQLQPTVALVKKFFL